MSTETVPGTGRPADELDASIDELAVNTIRTLAMDAVQAANSGHPGTPMALAPVAYTLWQQFLRFDPDDPIWPNRDRFVLSIGPRLDAALLAAAPDRASRRSTRSTRRSASSSVTLDDIKQLPPARQQVPGPSGVPLDLRRRDHHRPARPGRRDQRRHGDRRRLAGGALQPARASTLFDYDVYALVRRRLHDGRHLVARPRRSPATSSSSNLCWIYDNNHITIEGNTDARVHRRRRDALHRLRLERHARRRRQRPARCSRARSRRSSATHRPADADHRRQPHRLRRADKQDTSAAHGEPLGEEEIRLAKRSLRLAGGREVPRARRRARALRATASASAARELRDAWMADVRGATAQEYPELADQLERMQRRELPDGWDADLPDVPGRREGPGQPRVLGQGAERDRQERARG